MVRLFVILLAGILAVANAVEMVPVQENGMLRGPPSDETLQNRRLWGGWYTLLSKSLLQLRMILEEALA